MDKNYILSINKIAGLILLVSFIIVGIIFLFLPQLTIIFFNKISLSFNLQQLPVTGINFYLILAAAYMYLVSILAFFMFKFPRNSIFPLLLAHGKLASSLISLYIFFVHGPYLIYIANFIIDGFIGAAALLIYLKMERRKS